MKAKNETDQIKSLIKIIIDKVYALKYIYLASFLLFGAIAYIYNKYSTQVYELTTTMGPVKDARSATVLSNDMFSRGSTGRILEESINSLNSFDLVNKTIENLNLDIAYFVDSSRIFRRFIEIYYLQSPFVVNIDKSHIQSINTKFHVTILSDSTFRLKASEDKSILYHYFDNEIVAIEKEVKIDSVFKFNSTISSPYFRFTIYPSEELMPKASNKKVVYCFELYNPDELTKSYMKSLNIRPLSFYAVIINVQFKGANLQKSISFLNNYISNFLDDNLAKKNKIALSTINFIDSQISNMSDSLVTSESELSSFRSMNQVTDPSYQGQQIYQQMAVIEADRTKLEEQNRYYNYLLNYFKVNQDISGVTPPSSANITDPIMTNLISDMIDLIHERAAITNSNEKNVFLTQTENKIRTQKQLIIDHATNSLNTSTITLNDLNNRYQRLRMEIARLPRQEMNMVNYQRKYDLNSEQYSYLLQKRSEASMTLASTYPDFEVLEPAREITAKKIKPKSNINYLLSIFLGALLPSIFLIVRSFFTSKIVGTDSIEHMTDRAVFGVIYNNPKKSEAVVTESPRSAISESFRNLRSSLFLKLGSEKSKVIQITSAQPQDGKSFISLNLACSIASVDLKTVVIDCDLRCPVLHDKFFVENARGISDYMIKRARLDDIIQKTPIRNLFFIPAGNIIPNPSELISSGVLDDLFSLLKERFEFIVVDTPPLGIVSDTIQLTKYASQILLITRNNLTEKDALVNVMAVLELNKINNFEIVLNDMDYSKSPYSGYTNYYHKE